MANGILVCLGLVIFALANVSDGCATYFSTKEWKDKQVQFKAMLDKCADLFKTLTGSTEYKGNAVCNQYPMIQGYCYTRCKETVSSSGTSNGTIDIPKITCSPIRKDKPGRRPEQLHMSCQCDYTSDGIPASTTADTGEFSWKDVEDWFTTFVNDPSCKAS